MTDSKKTALVTGASAGLGAEFCRQLAAHCEVIIAVARRKERLLALAAEIPGVELHAIEADLSTVEGVTRTTEALRQQGPVDYLINNAGFGTFGTLVDTPLASQQRMIRLHIDATVELSRAAIPFMKERGGGVIINVASVGGFLAMRDTAVYGGTKAFLVSFSNSLQQEVVGQNIRVQCLCPGFTRTELQDTPEFEGFDKSRVPEELWMESEEVVTASLAALSQDTVVVVPGDMNRELVKSGLMGQLEGLG